jgi:hypothetical protein
VAIGDREADGFETFYFHPYLWNLANILTSQNLTFIPEKGLSLLLRVLLELNGNKCEDTGIQVLN